VALLVYPAVRIGYAARLYSIIRHRNLVPTSALLDELAVAPGDVVGCLSRSGACGIYGSRLSECPSQLFGGSGQNDQKNGALCITNHLILSDDTTCC
jgi:hypothetical protein